MPEYAELHAHSAFSFLDGVSLPEKLVAEAVRLGLAGLALTDHDGFYGIVRFAEAAEARAVRTVFGAELSLGLPGPQNGQPDPAGSHLLVLARGEEGYHRLAAALTHAQLTGAEKGKPVMITRFFTGPDGLTHAEEIRATFPQGGGVYNLLANSGAQIRRTPPGRVNDYHKIGRAHV